MRRVNVKLAFLNLDKSLAFSQALGLELKRLRLEKGDSQLTLALKAGVSRAAIQHIEKGIRNPTVLVAHAISQALGMSFSAVIKNVEQGGS